MDIDKEMKAITLKLKGIKNYDTIGFVFDLKTQVHQIDFFQRLKSTIFKPNPRPRIHQLAKFNLGHGYPKELYGGHWCYIINDFNSKFLVVPTTSVKKDTKIDEKFEFPIEVEDFKNELKTIFQISDIRVLDTLRLYKDEKFYNVLTDRDTIIEKLTEVIFDVV